MGLLGGNSTVTFYIGVGNCTTVFEDCNEALEPETEYAFKIRGFTNHGYRDSPVVIFITGTVVFELNLWQVLIDSFYR